MNTNGERLTVQGNSVEIALNDWPVAEGHEQHLWQTLEYVNDAIIGIQSVHEYADKIDGQTAKPATREVQRVRQRIVTAGRTIDGQLEFSPDIMELDDSVVDDAMEYYGTLREVNEELEQAWESLNDAAGAVESIGSGWSRVDSGESVSEAAFEARKAMWKVQAHIEQLLLSQFDASEADFDRPAEYLNW